MCGIESEASLLSLHTLGGLGFRSRSAMAKPPRGRPGDRPVGLSKGQKKKYRGKNERLKRKQREETAEIDDDEYGHDE